MDTYEAELYEAVQMFEAEMHQLAEFEAPLLKALKAGRKTEVKSLLASGADVNVRSPFGNSAALHVAALRGDRGTAATLLKYKADTDALDDAGETPLMKAARLGHQRVAEVLLEAGADVNVLGKPLDNASGRSYGCAALHYAAGGGHPGIVKILLEHGADANAQDDRGDTPLHYAAHAGLGEIVSTLLDYDADPLAANGDGDTALVWAARDGKMHLVEMMTAESAGPGRGTAGKLLGSRTDEADATQALIDEEFDFGQQGRTETAANGGLTEGGGWRLRGMLAVPGWLDVETVCLAVAFFLWFSARCKLRS
eukprot:g7863.t1